MLMESINVSSSTHYNANSVAQTEQRRCEWCSPQHTVGDTRKRDGGFISLFQADVLNPMQQ